jgi:hypothetical protein
MANIKEISDGGPNPNTPSVAEMRESQRKGSEGKGTSEYTFAQRLGCQDLGTGEGEGTDPEFPDAGAGSGGKGF